MKTIDKMGGFVNSVDAYETTIKSSHKHLYFCSELIKMSIAEAYIFEAETASQNENVKFAHLVSVSSL